MSVLPIRPLMKMIETDAFGSDRKNIKGIIYPHAGVDLKADKGTPVSAILDGVVVMSYYRKPITEGAISYGNLIVIYHGVNAKTGKHTYSLYAHLSKRWAEVNKSVSSGGIIAESGDTGNVPPHLHFEVKESPKMITWITTGRNMGVGYGQYKEDPMEFLKKPFLKNLEPLTEVESEAVHRMLDFRFIEGSRPTFFVKAPPFKEIMKKIRPGTDITGIKPPTITVEFQNLFDKKFMDQHPTLALNVNNRNLGRIKTGVTTYELDIWS